LTLCTIGSFAAFVLDPQSAIWNERLVPFWYLSIHLLAGWLVAAPLAWWRAREPRVRTQVREDDELADDEIGVDVVVDDPDERWYRRGFTATVLVASLGLASTVPGLMPGVASHLHLNTSGNQVSSWAEWNYSGYQGKSAWPEYHDLMSTMGRVGRRDGCGKAMWEYNSNQNRFGTPMALMLLPYWTNYCIDSMEGLFFESSATTPYHFLDQAELSASPSDPQVGLPYSALNVAQGVRHLQLLGVRYFIAFSPSVVAAANADPSLRPLTTTKNWSSSGGDQWHIYLVRNANVVAPLSDAPNVVSNLTSRTAWLSANVNWWMTPLDLSGPLLAASGPASWPHTTNPLLLRTRHEPQTTVSNVEVADQSVSFHVSRLGVPVVVRISYFTRWHVVGATGPYRVSPDVMVVVPTAHVVRLVYGSDGSVVAGNLVTDVTVVLGAAVWWMARRRRRHLR
jgi:hypothetical protein